MSFGIKLKCWGPYACFTRPEMKVERVSYEVMTPSAARGVLEAIYWKPQIKWAIDRIHVLNAIRFTNIRRNEVGSKIPLGTVKAAMRVPQTRIALCADDDRQQRAAMVLQNVCYAIEAHFEVEGGTDGPAKHKEMFDRRAAKGQCFHHPYLGCREFPAYFETIEDIPSSPLEGERQLGLMLYDIDFAKGSQAVFFNAVLRDGVLDVANAEVHS